jgi:hypothetical protein
VSSNNACHIHWFLRRIKHIISCFLGMVLGESFALEVDFDDDIDDFLT